MFTAEQVTIRYGQLTAVDNVSLEVKSGQCMAVVGPNGAGKSTLLKGMIGLMALSNGDVLLEGASIRKASLRRRMRLGVGLVPEGRMVIGNLSVLDNLELGAVAHGWRRPSADSIEEVLTLFPGLRDRSNQLAGSLSGGEQQMLAIARTLLGRPRVLLLDEPSLGLAPIVIDRMLSALHALKETGLTIVMVEQNARVALSIADEATVLVAGRVRYSGSVDHLKSDGVLAGLYLHAPLDHQQ